MSGVYGNYLRVEGFIEGNEDTIAEVNFLLKQQMEESLESVGKDISQFDVEYSVVQGQDSLAGPYFNVKIKATAKE